MKEDIRFMQRALQLAALGGVNTAPNPMVGAVIVYQGKIIGEGYHQKCGEAHAEVNAVAAVVDKSVLKEATMYVTLEPCSHHGKTPPCADMIVHNGFKRVVVACVDSFSEVSGRGIKCMVDAGILVDVGVLEEEARELNKRFFTFHEKKRPFVVLKWAQTQDGFMDRLPEERETGVNWITNPATKKWVHEWRSAEQAILVGVNTIINDDPQLNVRKIVAPSPLRFVIDPHGRIPQHAKVLNDGQPTFLLTKNYSYDFSLQENVTQICLASYTIQEVLNVLYSKNMLSVFVEGGKTTLDSFIEEHLWDEAKVLTGRSFFLAGITAPQLKKMPLWRTELGEDVLHYFRNV